MSDPATKRKRADTDQQPDDADKRRAAPPIVCYRVDKLPKVDLGLLQRAREGMEVVEEVVVPARDGNTFVVPAGCFFRIYSVDGPQVGDLNLWNQHDLTERFYSGKTRQLHASHVTTGDRLWSSLPGMRPMATITHDTLAWYGIDKDGGSVHDVIGTRCDPYTNSQLFGVDYNYCCHSNLTRALLSARGEGARGGGKGAVEGDVHDVLNVFMCTGFTRDTSQYFMKASPVRPGDYIEFFAEMDLLGALSACPGGDCGASHSDDATPCYPLHVKVYKPKEGALEGWEGTPAKAPYGGGHGLGGGSN